VGELACSLPPPRPRDDERRDGCWSCEPDSHSLVRPIEDVDEGVSIRLRNGGLIESFAFSDSLLADLCGDRAARRATIAIRTGQREHRDEPRDPGYRREIDVGWRGRTRCHRPVRRHQSCRRSSLTVHTSAG
jgi:hypothetical protein